MEDLICIFTYCPDFERRKVLIDFLNQIQSVRDTKQILLLSHSQVPEICHDLVDYVYIDSDNFLIENLNQRNKFWFQTNALEIVSTLVYPPSTHYAIYSLIHFAINFASFRGFKKIHCIEYDINLHDVDLINHISEKLYSFDNVMFRTDDGWLMGTYFAFKIDNLPPEYFKHNKEYIIEGISNISNRMTENFTPKFLGVNERTFYYESLDLLNPNGVYQKVDAHQNDQLNWCVPVCEIKNDMVYFFIFNEKGGRWNIDIICNKKHKSFLPLNAGSWILEPLCRISEFKDIIVLLNNKIKYVFELNEENKEDFLNNNIVNFK